ncbi:methylated-DNA--[protein]-cysteine S-methyltransferase [Pseudodesulfovibrio cashew]|uniref:methylated-DNA--[protein]-cysteine S-methyltransferase n=1 Tax=Pseudodesulfovibrio cashew TaxID=2678688 RepID=A0A6I6JAM5_9BACT|nr:methylated-DNA--[protein]-cysteine S-methyltransferase [Pseudodesulfovibrio cashew]QGY39816.1 methylated-DNA--[protein]-cysteine S-methyltransferase [Pseudodesulfovibrio cashew]
MISPDNASYKNTETVIAAPLALTICWAGGVITEIHLGQTEDATPTASLSPHAEALANALARYVNGEALPWPDLPLDFSQLTDFQRRAVQALRDIPQGEVRTYGQLATALGSPHGAQAIGKAMAANPFPLLYPCHRVVGKDGALVGFSAQGGLALKEYLLRLEGAWDKLAAAKGEDGPSQGSLLDLLE